jgi:hypothetical protein
MAYDAARGRTIIFGGWLGPSAPTSIVNDTWAFDGQTWTKLLPNTSPPARELASMVYDTRRKRLVLWGGRAGNTTFSDTWEWSGQDWKQLLPSGGPASMFGHAMAYDATRDRVVLFGASATGPQTWEWDGTSWWMQYPKSSPSARRHHAMAYDAARKRVLLFGGASGFPPLSDTWEWDGTNWTKQTPAVSPPGRYAHAMVYDPVRRRTVLGFGDLGPQSGNRTWEWDGLTWTHEIGLYAPTQALWHPGLVFDTVRRRVIAFGGTFQGFSTIDATFEYAAPYLLTRGSPRPGQVLTFTLEAPANSGRAYQLGSSFGTGPILVDTRLICLSPDPLLVATTASSLPSIFSGYRGTIDAKDRATATCRIPNLPYLIGTNIHSAFITLESSAPSGIWLISSATTFMITK